MTNQASEQALALDSIVGRAAAGEERAFAILVRAHHESMLRVAYVITGDREIAADAVQTAWSVAWRRLGTLRDASAIKAWLVAIAANEARLSLRRQRRRTVVELSMTPGGDTGDPGGRIAIVDLQRAMRGLSADDRMLLALRYTAGMESAEIAQHLHLSASGVRSRLARLLERLRRELDHD